MVLSFPREKSPLYTPHCNMGATSHEGFRSMVSSFPREKSPLYTPHCNMGATSHEGFIHFLTCLLHMQSTMQSITYMNWQFQWRR